MDTTEDASKTNASASVSSARMGGWGIRMNVMPSPMPSPMGTSVVLATCTLATIWLSPVTMIAKSIGEDIAIHVQKMIYFLILVRILKPPLIRRGNQNRGKNAIDFKGLIFSWNNYLQPKRL